MRESTARDYLDGMSSAAFRSAVAPYLATKDVLGEVRYTRASLDNWIERDGRQDVDTAADMARWLDKVDADLDRERPSTRRRARTKQ